MGLKFTAKQKQGRNFPALVIFNRENPKIISKSLFRF